MMAKAIPMDVRRRSVARVLEDGESAATVARSIGVTPSAVQRWVSLARNGESASMDELQDPALLRVKIRTLEAEVDTLRNLVRYLAKQ